MDDLVQEEKEVDLEYLDRARESILHFTWLIKKDYEVNWHHRFLANKLNAFVRGEIPYLMVFMPPRHGKSELVSRKLPAFIHGLYPDSEIMAASYLDSLASDMTTDVQKIMDTEIYQKIFPETKLYSQGTKYSVGTRNSSEHHIVGRKGKYRGQGVGGSFTGKGANFCFISGTQVLTRSGKRNIQDLKVGDLVWSLNHETGALELKRIEAVSSRIVSRLVQIKTSSGSEMLCTPEHPFFIEGRGYIPSQIISNGFRAWRFVQTKENDLHFRMRSLRKIIRTAALRLLETIKPWPFGYVLFKSMFKKASQFQKSKKMCQMRNSDEKQSHKILQQRVQTKLERRIEKICSTISNWVWSNKDSNSCKRWFSVSNLQFFKKDSRSSYRRKQKERFAREFNYSLYDLSYETSSKIKRDPIISTLEINVGSIAVFDIQVEGNHNFFAEGILVSNCIIDDPIKGREIADSVAFRERLWNFYNNDLFSRLETDLATGRQGQILITQTRWHEDDLSGRLIDLMRKDPLSVQWQIIDFPAIKTNNDNPDDPRQIGQALWPNKYNLEQLAQIKASIGNRAWGSLYQQTPVPDGGALFNSNMFEVCEIPQSFDWKFITADIAYKEKQENDFTVFSAWGVVDKDLYLIDVWRKQIKASDIEVPARTFIKSHMTEFNYRGTWIEPKGHGIYLNQKFAMESLAIPSEYSRDEFFKDRRFDKLERANNAIPHLSNRKIYINRNLNNKEDLINECLVFPKGKHDDFCDTLVDAIKMVYSRKPSTLETL